ncbi:TPA: hypothetical protein ACVU5C_003741 [Vibrio parahaemolyticus]
MTHAVLSHTDQQTSMISRVLTEFMIDLAAVMARDDYETRRKRQAQGIEKAKTLGKYQGRKPDLKLRENIQLLLTERKRKLVTNTRAFGLQPFYYCHGKEIKHHTAI